MITHAYNEEIARIVRGNDVITQAAIDAAIEEVQSYLLKDYDVTTIFAATGANRSPMLLAIVKDVAIWRLIALANPSVYYEDRKARYEQAIEWLQAVFKGMPTTLTKKPEPDPSTDSGAAAAWGSNTRKEQHY